MTKQQKAIALLQKQRDIEKQMMNDIKNYMNSKDKRYGKLKRRYIEAIDILDYIIMRLR